ncbi:MAG TPA: 16S rRNA (cytosine(1402)-N(4))-methyltransferase RsmH [Firmicutes bacterium]|jgi:16S rRNA (cytosine1402-N4)-methyltransferase|uniref:16S rRNA (cytosine(1402)-N(4))-methyltransferase RsmH n=1 Tax=Gelria sp. Kuro-4 TaxID=2796927 RepID=UPI0019B09C91|nr:16S rRNA (cytosine(1402)-N(4))-methyltransferase RsmH [Gelria sp. Kuro-4]MDI3521862.1 rRNA (cytosine1402-N4)-methyltransferase [Bacillota bacterium]MDK2926342.1 rRNA (cytosine1402-N4)-methyltransferase [Bacillota bacterium]BCV24682.1 ribosomal RNA small subunit methyltransferase H [Gelria sp. Kuro-4]HHV56984.1 16S rRNA (cytosine(1402)-N(4))-methyltransferase RsmH [Bacillota bacterium]
MRFQHQPVLLSETLAYLACRPGGIYIDCTLGGGGHAREILLRSTPGGLLLGIDRDAAALEAARERLAPFKERVRLVQGNFRELAGIWRASSLPAPQGILFDLGVSSPQLDEPERGFSYQVDAPLDMRMDKRQELTARQIVNTWPRHELARIIREYGEERWALRIAGFIDERRRRAPLETTGELVDVIKEAIPAAVRRHGPHPARRTFQALRIAVNDELGALKEGLAAAGHILAPGGRVCVISFHSLEDRIAKHTLRQLAAAGELELLTKKPVTPGEEEIQNNPRSRSAKLRAAERVLDQRRDA